MRFAVALVWVAAALAPVTSAASEVVGRCSVVFTASSTLHDFEGRAPCARLEIAPEDSGGAYRARAEVVVKEISTGISGRDEEMREMFDADRHPRIAASFAGVTRDALRAGRKDALPFRLAIRGVERSVTPEISGWSEVPGERARFRARFDVSLSDFGLEAPVAMGFMRVDDRVQVVVDVELDAR